MDFNNRTYLLITGASKGIGKCIAIECCKKLKENSLVCLMARSSDGLLNTRNEILKINNKIDVKIYPIDLTDTNATELNKIILDSVLNYKVEEFKLSWIIHNVGSVGDVKKNAKLLDNTIEWENYFKLNVFNVATLNSQFLKIFLNNKKFIVNITSKCCLVPFKSMALYCSGKAAREMYFRVLAEEEKDLWILNYSPGPVDTDMSMDIQNNSVDNDIKAYFKMARDKKEILTVDQTTKKFLKIINEWKFKSGDHVDYYDDE